MATLVNWAWLEEVGALPNVYHCVPVVTASLQSRLLDTYPAGCVQDTCDTDGLPQPSPSLSWYQVGEDLTVTLAKPHAPCEEKHVFSPLA